nr:hypothetical protein [uncultured Allomuricauda sp.]
MKKIYLTTLLILSLYFVVGGISNILIDEMFERAQQLPEKPVGDASSSKFRNIEEMNASLEYDKMTAAYPTYLILGDTLSYIVNLICFGIFGSIIRVLILLQQRNRSLEKIKVYSLVVLSAMIGLITIIVSQLIPEFKYESSNQKMYYSLALVGGIYSNEFFAWLKFKVKQIFSTESET